MCKRGFLIGLGAALVLGACQHETGTHKCAPAQASVTPTEGPEIACPGQVPLGHGEYSFAATLPPQVVTQTPPEYPQQAARRGVRGIVILRGVVDDQGVVRQTRILRSVPMLDDAAASAVCKWRFTPAQFQWSPIAVAMTVTVEFPPRSR